MHSRKRWAGNEPIGSKWYGGLRESPPQLPAHGKWWKCLTDLPSRNLKWGGQGVRFGILPGRELDYVHVKTLEEIRREKELKKRRAQGILSTDTRPTVSTLQVQGPSCSVMEPQAKSPSQLPRPCPLKTHQHIDAKNKERAINMLNKYLKDGIYENKLQVGKTKDLRSRLSLGVRFVTDAGSGNHCAQVREAYVQNRRKWESIEGKTVGKDSRACSEEYVKLKTASQPHLGMGKGQEDQNRQDVENYQKTDLDEDDGSFSDDNSDEEDTEDSSDDASDQEVQVEQEAERDTEDDETSSDGSSEDELASSESEESKPDEEQEVDSTLTADSELYIDVSNENEEMIDSGSEENGEVEDDLGGDENLHDPISEEELLSLESDHELCGTDALERQSVTGREDRQVEVTGRQEKTQVEEGFEDRLSTADLHEESSDLYDSDSDAEVCSASADKVLQDFGNEKKQKKQDLQGQESGEDIEDGGELLVGNSDGCEDNSEKEASFSRTSESVDERQLDKLNKHEQMEDLQGRESGEENEDIGDGEKLSVGHSDREPNCCEENQSDKEPLFSTSAVVDEMQRNKETKGEQFEEQENKAVEVNISGDKQDNGNLVDILRNLCCHEEYNTNVLCEADKQLEMGKGDEALDGINNMDESRQEVWEVLVVVVNEVCDKDDGHKTDRKLQENKTSGQCLGLETMEQSEGGGQEGKGITKIVKEMGDILDDDNLSDEVPPKELQLSQVIKTDSRPREDTLIGAGVLKDEYQKDENMTTWSKNEDAKQIEDINEEGSLTCETILPQEDNQDNVISEFDGGKEVGDQYRGKQREHSEEDEEAVLMEGDSNVDQGDDKPFSDNLCGIDNDEELMEKNQRHLLGILDKIKSAEIDLCEEGGTSEDSNWEKEDDRHDKNEETVKDGTEDGKLFEEKAQKLIHVDNDADGQIKTVELTEGGQKEEENIWEDEEVKDNAKEENYEDIAEDGTAFDRDCLQEVDQRTVVDDQEGMSTAVVDKANKLGDGGQNKGASETQDEEVSDNMGTGEDITENDTSFSGVCDKEIDEETTLIAWEETDQEVNVDKLDEQRKSKDKGVPEVDVKETDKDDRDRCTEMKNKNKEGKKNGANTDARTVRAMTSEVYIVVQDIGTNIDCHIGVETSKQSSESQADVYNNMYMCFQKQGLDGFSIIKETTVDDTTKQTDVSSATGEPSVKQRQTRVGRKKRRMTNQRTVEVTDEEFTSRYKGGSVILEKDALNIVEKQVVGDDRKVGQLLTPPQRDRRGTQYSRTKRASAPGSSDAMSSLRKQMVGDDVVVKRKRGQPCLHAVGKEKGETLRGTQRVSTPWGSGSRISRRNVRTGMTNKDKQENSRVSNNLMPKFESPSANSRQHKGLRRPVEILDGKNSMRETIKRVGRPKRTGTATNPQSVEGSDLIQDDSRCEMTEEKPEAAHPKQQIGTRWKTRQRMVSSDEANKEKGQGDASQSIQEQDEQSASEKQPSPEVEVGVRSDNEGKTHSVISPASKKRMTRASWKPRRCKRMRDSDDCVHQPTEEEPLSPLDQMKLTASSLPQAEGNKDKDIQPVPHQNESQLESTTQRQCVKQLDNNYDRKDDTAQEHPIPPIVSTQSSSSPLPHTEGNTEEDQEVQPVIQRRSPRNELTESSHGLDTSRIVKTRGRKPLTPNMVAHVLSPTLGDEANTDNDAKMQVSLSETLQPNALLSCDSGDDRATPSRKRRKAKIHQASSGLSSGQSENQSDKDNNSERAFPSPSVACSSPLRKQSRKRGQKYGLPTHHFEVETSVYAAQMQQMSALQCEPKVDSPSDEISTFQESFKNAIIQGMASSYPIINLTPLHVPEAHLTAHAAAQRRVSPTECDIIAREASSTRLKGSLMPEREAEVCSENAEAQPPEDVSCIAAAKLDSTSNKDVHQKWLDAIVGVDCSLSTGADGYCKVDSEVHLRLPENISKESCTEQDSITRKRRPVRQFGKKPSTTISAESLFTQPEGQSVANDTEEQEQTSADTSPSSSRRSDSGVKERNRSPVMLEMSSVAEGNCTEAQKLSPVVASGSPSNSRKSSCDPTTTILTRGKSALVPTIIPGSPASTELEANSNGTEVQKPTPVNTQPSESIQQDSRSVKGGAKGATNSDVVPEDLAPAPVEACGIDNAKAQSAPSANGSQILPVICDTIGMKLRTVSRWRKKLPDPVSSDPSSEQTEGNFNEENLKTPSESVPQINPKSNVRKTRATRKWRTRPPEAKSDNPLLRQGGAVGSKAKDTQMELLAPDPATKSSPKRRRIKLKRGNKPQEKPPEKLKEDDFKGNAKTTHPLLTSELSTSQSEPTKLGSSDDTGTVKRVKCSVTPEKDLANNSDMNSTVIQQIPTMDASESPSTVCDLIVTRQVLRQKLTPPGGMSLPVQAEINLTEKETEVHLMPLDNASQSDPSCCDAVDKHSKTAKKRINRQSSIPSKPSTQSDGNDGKENTGIQLQTSKNTTQADSSHCDVIGKKLQTAKQRGKKPQQINSSSDKDIEVHQQAPENAALSVQSKCDAIGKKRGRKPKKNRMKPPKIDLFGTSSSFSEGSCSEKPAEVYQQIPEIEFHGDPSLCEAIEKKSRKRKRIVPHRFASAYPLIQSEGIDCGMSKEVHVHQIAPESDPRSAKRRRKQPPELDSCGPSWTQSEGDDNNQSVKVHHQACDNAILQEAQPVISRSRNPAGNVPSDPSKQCGENDSEKDVEVQNEAPTNIEHSAPTRNKTLIEERQAGRKRRETNPEEAFPSSEAGEDHTGKDSKVHKLPPKDISNSVPKRGYSVVKKLRSIRKRGRKPLSKETVSTDDSSSTQEEGEENANCDTVVDKLLSAVVVELNTPKRISPKACVSNREVQSQENTILSNIEESISKDEMMRQETKEGSVHSQESVTNEDGETMPKVKRETDDGGQRNTLNKLKRKPFKKRFSGSPPEKSRMYSQGDLANGPSGDAQVSKLINDEDGNKEDPKSSINACGDAETTGSTVPLVDGSKHYLCSRTLGKVSLLEILTNQPTVQLSRLKFGGTIPLDGIASNKHSMRPKKPAKRGGCRRGRYVRSIATKARIMTKGLEAAQGTWERLGFRIPSDLTTATMDRTLDGCCRSTLPGRSHSRGRRSVSDDRITYSSMTQNSAVAIEIVEAPEVAHTVEVVSMDDLPAAPKYQGCFVPRALQGSEKSLSNIIPSAQLSTCGMEVNTSFAGDSGSGADSNCELDKQVGILLSEYESMEVASSTVEMTSSSEEGTFFVASPSVRVVVTKVDKMPSACPPFESFNSQATQDVVPRALPLIPGTGGGTRGGRARVFTSCSDGVVSTRTMARVSRSTDTTSEGDRIDSKNQGYTFMEDTRGASLLNQEKSDSGPTPPSTQEQEIDGRSFLLSTEQQVDCQAPSLIPGQQTGGQSCLFSREEENGGRTPPLSPAHHIEGQTVIKSLVQQAGGQSPFLSQELQADVPIPLPSSSQHVVCQTPLLSAEQQLGCQTPLLSPEQQVVPQTPLLSQLQQVGGQTPLLSPEQQLGGQTPILSPAQQVSGQSERSTEQQDVVDVQTPFPNPAKLVDGQNPFLSPEQQFSGQNPLLLSQEQVASGQALVQIAKQTLSNAADKESNGLSSSYLESNAEKALPNNGCPADNLNKRLEPVGYDKPTHSKNCSSAPASCETASKESPGPATNNEEDPQNLSLGLADILLSPLVDNFEFPEEDCLSLLCDSPGFLDDFGDELLEIDKQMGQSEKRHSGGSSSRHANPRQGMNKADSGSMSRPISGNASLQTVDWSEVSQYQPMNNGLSGGDCSIPDPGRLNRNNEGKIVGTNQPQAAPWMGAALTNQIIPKGYCFEYIRTGHCRRQRCTFKHAPLEAAKVRQGDNNGQQANRPPTTSSRVVGQDMMSNHPSYIGSQQSNIHNSSPPPPPPPPLPPPASYYPQRPVSEFQPHTQLYLPDDGSAGPRSALLPMHAGAHSHYPRPQAPPRMQFYNPQYRGVSQNLPGLSSKNAIDFIQDLSRWGHVSKAWMEFKRTSLPRASSLALMVQILHGCCGQGVRDPAKWSVAYHVLEELSHIPQYDCTVQCMLLIKHLLQDGETGEPSTFHLMAMKVFNNLLPTKPNTPDINMALMNRLGRALLQQNHILPLYDLVMGMIQRKAMPSMDIINGVKKSLQKDKELKALQTLVTALNEGQSVQETSNTEIDFEDNSTDPARKLMDSDSKKCPSEVFEASFSIQQCNMWKDTTDTLLDLCQRRPDVARAKPVVQELMKKLVEPADMAGSKFSNFVTVFSRHFQNESLVRVLSRLGINCLAMCCSMRKWQQAFYILECLYANHFPYQQELGSDILVPHPKLKLFKWDISDVWVALVAQVCLEVREPKYVVQLLADPNVHVLIDEEEATNPLFHLNCKKLEQLVILCVDKLALSQSLVLLRHLHKQNNYVLYTSLFNQVLFAALDNRDEVYFAIYQEMQTERALTLEQRNYRLLISVLWNTGVDFKRQFARQLHAGGFNNGVYIKFRKDQRYHEAGLLFDLTPGEVALTLDSFLTDTHTRDVVARHRQRSTCLVKLSFINKDPVLATNCTGPRNILRLVDSYLEELTPPIKWKNSVLRSACDDMLHQSYSLDLDSISKWLEKQGM